MYLKEKMRAKRRREWTQAMNPPNRWRSASGRPYTSFCFSGANNISILVVWTSRYPPCFAHAVIKFYVRAPLAL